MKLNYPCHRLAQAHARRKCAWHFYKSTLDTVDSEIYRVHASACLLAYCGDFIYMCARVFFLTPSTEEGDEKLRTHTRTFVITFASVVVCIYRETTTPTTTTKRINLNWAPPLPLNLVIYRFLWGYSRAPHTSRRPHRVVPFQ